MTEQHLAVRAAAAMPSPSEWQTLVEMARVLVPTGFLPKDIRTPEQAVAVILKGRELRVPPMHALSSIVVVQGKPVCSAELMLALIYRDHGDLAVVVEESTPTVCRVGYRRPGWDKARSFAFSIEDARTAGLAGKGTWAQYPQAMLRARCISAVARLAFPDSIAGMYTPEELGASVRVTEDGAVEVDAVAAPAPTVPRERPGPRGSTIVREGGTDVVFGYDRPPRGPAIAAALDAEVAETDALLNEPIPTTLEPEMIAEDRRDPTTGEVPGPRWARTPRGLEAAALYEQMMAANQARTARGMHPIHRLMPADNATDAEVEQWIAAGRRSLTALAQAQR